MVLKPNAVVDIAKQGPQLQNLTGMWNARVLDGFTPFVVQFKENGLPVNLTDLNAFIEGDIGEGHYDSSTDDIVMTGTPKSVRYTDDGSGNTNMGIVVFRLPPQFFIQTGIFKGFIGLQSLNGIRSTSNDVWFKVLGSSYTMGISCKYFISDFQKALDQANGKVEQALQNLNVDYQNIAENAHDSATAAQCEIDAVRADSKTLAGTIGDLQAQVKAGGLETIINHDKDINEIRTRIDNRLKQISNQVPAFSSLEALKAKYPLGTDGLFRIGDQGYMWQNDEWENIGELQSAAVSDSDYTERLGYFMSFGNDMMPSITENKKWLDESKQNEWSGYLDIPEGQILLLGSEGKIFRFDKEQKVTYSYKQSDVNKNNSLLTFYFDGISNVYASFKPARRNDTVIFSLYRGIIYGINTDKITINNKLNSGLQNIFPKQNIMNFDNPISISVQQNTNDSGIDTYSGQIKIPSDTVIWDSIFSKTFKKINSGQTLNYSYSQTDVNANGLYTVFYSIEKSQFYSGFIRQSAFDYSIFSIFSDKVYDTNLDNFVVNGKPFGGHFDKRIQKAYSLTFDNLNPINVQEKWDTKENSYSGKITIPAGSIFISKKNMRIIEIDDAKSIDFSYSQKDVRDNFMIPSLFFDLQNRNFYFDFSVHNDQDLLIFSIYRGKVYDTFLRNVVVNNVGDGGHGKYLKRDLTDWRILANNGQDANIAWLGDSTFAGFRVKDNTNIAATYINRLLPSLYPKVRSYNVSKSGWSTRGLADSFDTLIKDVPNLKLVIIGGGLNDGGKVADSKAALQDIVNKAYSIGATPVITTTQVSAVPFVSKADGGDWDLTNIQSESINEMRREFAKENNIDLIDLTRLDEDFAEFSSLPLHELFTYSDNFNDYLHGIDKIHQFEAQAVFAYLAADKIDLINRQKTVSIFTMRAKSELSANKYQKELLNDSLNAKGFKASWQGTDLKDKVILEYSFFIPASENKYYLNGYNLGDKVKINLNGDITELNGNATISNLEAGYYHIIVTAETNNANFVGLRIEAGKLTDTTNSDSK